MGGLIGTFEMFKLLESALKIKLPKENQIKILRILKDISNENKANITSEILEKYLNKIPQIDNREKIVRFLRNYLRDNLKDMF
ncbi:MAG: hypothetical protein PUB96_08745 [Helicobacteraceae bacterium]|nr:hypothetical protein [Helicobacteraceae bacterium]